MSLRLVLAPQAASVAREAARGETLRARRIAAALSSLESGTTTSMQVFAYRQHLLRALAVDDETVILFAASRHLVKVAYIGLPPPDFTTP